MKSSSGAIDDIRSVPLAACCSYQGRAYRSGPPGLPREARTEWSRESGETKSRTSHPGLYIFMVKKFVQISFIFTWYSLLIYKDHFSPPVESRVTLGKAPRP
jgi:hypothetical protein